MNTPATLQCQASPIGVFDSGYGGLTVLRELRKQLPQFDFLYLGDNARAPYGSRSFEVVYEFTWQCVHYLFEQGCPLVILACNTASAKALRSIQQINLPAYDAQRRVLGVVRPTVERVGEISRTGHVGLVATEGTVSSGTYGLELAKFWPHLSLTAEACPMWVPLVESNEADSAGADFFVKHHLDNLLRRDPKIDTLILGCTHYPLLLPTIRKHLPSHVAIISQGSFVADSLVDYLQRHADIAARLSRHGIVSYLTTERPNLFNIQASRIMSQAVEAQHILV